LASEAERRLAAIMFTDMVGYTSLSQKNETLALELLEEQRKILRSSFSKYNAKEIKTIGDGVLAEFASALEATNCAFDVQRTLHQLKISRDTERSAPIRIGIHLGDVIHSKDDVYGDAVNVASRIEQFASPSGVCITEQVYSQVENKVVYPIVKLGSKELKNVRTPMNLYKIIMPWEKQDMQDSTERAVLDKNRVAVLPFKNLSPDPNDEYFADGMTEELITALSGVRELSVIARTSVMKYKNELKGVSEIGKELGTGSIVEGSVRKAGGKVRVTVQLVSAENQSHLWAQNYDKQLDDIFAVQTDIAKRVAKALRVRLREDEQREIERPAAENLEAYNLYLKGRYFWNKRTEESVKEAIRYFKRAIELDSSFALGYAGLADCHFVLATNELQDLIGNFKKAKVYAAKALEHDDKLAEAHTTLAAILHYADYEFKRSEEEFKKAIELKPSYATAHQWYSTLLVEVGRPEQAYSELMAARDLDPLSLIINVNVGNYYLNNKEYQKAIDQFKKVLQAEPDFSFAHVGLARAYCLEGKYDEALREIDVLSGLIKEKWLADLYRSRVFAFKGDKTNARTLLKKFESVEDKSSANYINIATVLFLLGDKDDGFIWLEKAYERREPDLPMIQIFPELDGVRDDPRFRAIVKKMGLE